MSARTEKIKEIQLTVNAIADGYPHGVMFHDDEYEAYVWAENPNYQPDDGSNPRLIIRAIIEANGDRRARGRVT